MIEPQLSVFFGCSFLFPSFLRCLQGERDEPNTKASFVRLEGVLCKTIHLAQKISKPLHLSEQGGRVYVFSWMLWGYFSSLFLCQCQGFLMFFGVWFRPQPTETEKPKFFFSISSGPLSLTQGNVKRLAKVLGDWIQRQLFGPMFNNVHLFSIFSFTCSNMFQRFWVISFGIVLDSKTLWLWIWLDS